MEEVNQTSSNLSGKIDYLAELTTTLVEKIEIAELRIKDHGERTESLEKRLEMIADLLDEEKRETITEGEKNMEKVKNLL